MATVTAVPSQKATVFPHILALDGLRGLAVLFVLTLHLLWSNPHTGNRLMDLLSSIRLSTYIGVNIFFVLSGFLITNILLNSVDREGYFKSFYIRRSLRIFPCTTACSFFFCV